MRLSDITTEELASAAQRLQEKSIPVPWSGCRIWTASINEKGYGVIGIGRKGTVLAHRLSLWILLGHFDEHLAVLHTCDTPCCIEPRHARLGTLLDNSADMAQKWRGRRSKRGLPFGVTIANGKDYQAQVTFHKRNYYVGAFRTAEEASSAAVIFKRWLYEDHP